MVCNKQSTGNHYGVRTCTGCKLFFMRSMREKVTYLDCPFNKKCYSVDSSKYKCRECRLNKCIEVGMRIDYKSITGWEIWKELENPTAKPISLIRVLTNIDSEITKLRFSTYNPIFYTTLEDTIKRPSLLYLASQFKPMPGWPLKKSDCIDSRKKLTLKRCSIEHQNHDVNTYHDSINYEECINKDWSVFDAIMSIEYAKTFPFFEKLENEDKIILIRETNVIVAFLVTQFVSYSGKKDVIQTPDGFFHDDKLTKSDLEVLFAAVIPDGMPYVSMNFFSLEPYFRNNFTYDEYLLMKAIAFCYPVDQLSPYGKQIIQQERQKYGNILLSYCLTTTSNPSRFLTILEHVSLLIRAQRAFKNFRVYMRIKAASKASTSRILFEDQIFS
ncbi:unnamed protein product [Caenorhabditis angaria]|uniref:Nuclear receptor domain-containing protein n=1 Tax=Caenorhabditis angaria TaxID=860376 RepID=A0A9P1IUK4_9PELO|nr:unnamed protein product [Caenorhabditis angaria]